MTKNITSNANAPVIKYTEYLKFGFVKTRFQDFYCPHCGKQLNAGWNYQPKFCAECGQLLDFSEVTYEEEEFLGYSEDAYEKASELMRRLRG